MKITHIVSTACILSALVTLPACNNDTPTGALTVPFQLGTSGACSYKNAGDMDLPVEKVRVALYRPGTIGSAEPVAEDFVECEDGEALFTTVNAGTYEVVAEGLDLAQLIVFDNEGEGNVVEILEGQDIIAETVRLNLTPVKLYVRWSFAGFDFNQCTQVPLKTLGVEARRDDGNSPLGDGEFTCDQAADGEMGYRLLVDDDRRLNGNDLDTVEITPKDAAGKTIGDVATFAFDPPGPGRTVNLTVSITCTATNCDLSGSGMRD